MTRRRRELLAADEVHLWSCRLDRSTRELGRLEGVLSAEENARAERLRRPLDRARWTIARATLRQVLSRYLPGEPGELRFRTGARGKPALSREDRCGVHFNLSHSEDLLLLAIARGREVGVDVEHLGRARDWERIARRFYSPSERHALAAAPPAQRQEAFLRLWTRREALGKALGEGVFHSLREVDLGPAPALELPPPVTGTQLAGWWLHESVPAPGFRAALVVEGSTCTLVRRSAEASPPAESTGKSGTGAGRRSPAIFPDHHA